MNYNYLEDDLMGLKTLETQQNNTRHQRNDGSFQ